MFRVLKFALLSLALPGSALAQCDGQNLIETLTSEERSVLDQAVAEHAYPEGNFWRADKPGSTVHVVGTMHVPDPRLDLLAGHAMDLLQEADRLILETTSAAEAGMNRLMAERPEVAFITEGPTLIDLLGEEDWAEVESRLIERGIPGFMGAKFKPWLLFITLSVPACAMQDLASGEPGLDGLLEQEAVDLNIPVETLDDLDALIQMLSGNSPEEQIDLLRAGLALEFDETGIFSTTLDSYFAGRHRELVEFSMMLTPPEMRADMEAFMGDLLEGRNQDWEPKIAELVNGKDAMIAVGAAHLSGETGVLRTLERLGYTLTRLDD